MSPSIWLDLLEHSFLFVTQVALDYLGGLLNERATGTEPVTLGQLVKDLTPVALLVCSGETQLADQYLILITVIFPQTDIALYQLIVLVCENLYVFNVKFLRLWFFYRDQFIS